MAAALRLTRGFPPFNQNLRQFASLRCRKVFGLLQLWQMVNVIRQIWRDWKVKQQRQRAHKFLQKRRAILQDGLHIYADVLDCQATCICSSQLKLVRLRLSIPIKDKLSVQTSSTTFF